MNILSLYSQLCAGFFIGKIFISIIIRISILVIFLKMLFILFALDMYFSFSLLCAVKEKEKLPKEKEINATVQNLQELQCTKLLAITTFLSMLCQIIAPQKQVVHFATLTFTIVFATSAFRFAPAYAKSDNSKSIHSSFAALMPFSGIQASGLCTMLKNQTK